jgi:hypothetical protein
MTVLVAAPYRQNTLQAFLHRHREVVSGFTYPHLEHVMMKNDLRHVQGGKYAPNAAARNLFIEAYLKPHHKYVLWLDVDVVQAPADLVERLLAVCEASKPAFHRAAAPFVLIEGSEQFYDYGGFTQGGRQFRQRPPYCEGGDVVELDSCGTCYLVPAWVYRQDCWYSFQGGEVEHVPFFRCARRKGLRVFGLRDVVVRHADLPKWGEAWH